MWKQQVLLLLIVGVSVVNLGFWFYSPDGENLVSQTIDNDKVQEKLNDNETEIIKASSDVSYPRYTGRKITDNVNMINQISSTQYYWSISNPYVNNFRSDLELNEPCFFIYDDYDDRTALNTLSGVQYYVTAPGDDEGMPYGYILLIDDANSEALLQQKYLDALQLELGMDELTDAQSQKITNSLRNKYALYRNEYALPLGYCYESYIDQTTWESLNAVQKQEIQLDAAYVDDSFSTEVSEYIGDIPNYSIPFEIECKGDDIVKTETGFLTTTGGATAVLSFEGVGNSETYICFEGLDFKATPEYDLYFGDETVDPLNLYNKTNWELLSRDRQASIRKAKIFWNNVNAAILTLTSSEDNQKTLLYQPPDAMLSSGRHNFIINLGYCEEPITSITIAFSSYGTYTIDNLQVYNVPMNQYAEKISALQENTLQNITLDTDTVRGEINVNSPQLLCLAMPYSTGWKAFIDGEETPVMLTNERYLGISVPVGFHTIEFHYDMPYKRAGITLSLVGMAALIAIVALTEKRHRTKKTPVNS